MPLFALGSVIGLTIISRYPRVWWLIETTVLTIKELEKLIKSRREAADVLFSESKYDEAVYLAGYAVELSLKLHILRNGFPETEDEFKVYKDAKTHNLDKLLGLAGKKELREEDEYGPAWEAVRKNWSAECRYRKIGDMTKEAAKYTIESVSYIIERLSS